MKKNQFVDAACALFILLFLYTGTSKLLEIHSFRIVLQRSPLAAPYAGTIAWAVPAAELAIAAMLFAGKTKPAGLLAATVLMGLFTVYIAYMLLFSPRLPCSCGGIIKRLSWRWHLVFNAGFVALGVIAIRKNNIAGKQGPGTKK